MQPTAVTIHIEREMLRRAPAAKTEDYLYSQLIPYLGNKRRLLGLIRTAIALTERGSGVFADLFCGSGVVSRMAKQMGYGVIANDWEPYAFEINNCYVACHAPPPFASLGGAGQALRLLNALEPSAGWTARHLCPVDDAHPDTATERLFFTQANGAKIDSIRTQIQSWQDDGLIDTRERSYLLAPLLFAASYVSNTSGVFKGFHNGWGGKTRTALYRILSDLHLRTPVLHPGDAACEAWMLDAQDAASRLARERRAIAIAYLDPPYNQHPYASNYHVLNSIALWDQPDVARSTAEGSKSAIRLDWRDTRRSAYNYRSAAADAFGLLLDTLPARSILISYSTDGIIPLPDLLEIAERRGHLSCVLSPYKRYRVSTQRMSSKPLNVEFVLIIDASRRKERRAQEIYDAIVAAETDALLSHPETMELAVQPLSQNKCRLQ